MNWYFIALKKYAVFSGRSRRKEYWYKKGFLFDPPYFSTSIEAAFEALEKFDSGCLHFSNKLQTCIIDTPDGSWVRVEAETMSLAIAKACLKAKGVNID